MAITDLGRALILPQGVYNPSKTYYRLDLVTYDGGSYVAKAETQGNLPTNTTYWQIIALSGATTSDLAVVDAAGYYTAGSTVETAFAQIGRNAILFTPVTESANKFTCDVQNMGNKNFNFSINNAVAKEIILTNVMDGRNEIFLEVSASATAAITWTLGKFGSGVPTIKWTWNIPPYLVAGNIYRILLMTSNGGARWNGFTSPPIET